MALTVNDTKFGAGGVSDPVLFHPGIDAIKRKVNFKATPLTPGTSYSLFGLPKAFVVTGAFIEETVTCPKVNITLGTKGGTASDVMAATALGGATLARGAKQLATAKVLDEGDIVALTATAQSNETVTSVDFGEVNVVVYGYTPYGDGLGNVVTPDYRTVEQPKQNVAAIDPWQENAVRRG